MRRRRLAALGAALALALPLGLAGCGGDDDSAAPPATTAGTTATSTPTAPPEPEATVAVTVVDGDTGDPVGGARVRGGGGPDGPVDAVAGPNGVAQVPESAQTVVARSPDHGPTQVPLAGARTEVEIYQADLQAPQYGGGPERLRSVPDVEMDPPAQGQRPNWIFDAITLIEFPPAVRDGLAVFGVNSGRVFALDTDTGEIVWETRQEGPIAASPAFFENLVLVSSMDGMLSAYDAQSGEPAWQLPTNASPIESSPLVVDGTAYVGTWEGILYAADARTGAERWRFQAPDDIKGSAALAGERIVVGDYLGNLHALDPNTGEREWVYSGGQRFYGGPGVSGDTIVIGDVGGDVMAVDAATGAERWRHSTGGAFVYSSPAIADGAVYIGSYDGQFQRLDLATGAVEWSFNVGGRISGSATVVDGTVYTSLLYAEGQPRRTFGLDTASGEEVFRTDDGRYTPAVAAGDTLFLVGTRLLYAYHASGPDGPTVERAAEIGG